MVRRGRSWRMQDMPAIAEGKAPFWPRRLRSPRMLCPGDRVAIVTPSWGGPACFPQRFEAGLRYLADTFRLDPVVMPQARRPAEWLDRNPQARAEDIMLAFEDARISGVIASIGGDDAIRLMPYLDLAVIAANPKVLLGYSDATVLHFACLKAGVTSFYGPTIMDGFAENCGMHAMARDAVRATLMSTGPVGKLPRNTHGWTDEWSDWSQPRNQDRARRLNAPLPAKVWQGTGRVRGPLIGGCAEVLEMLKGTGYWPPLERWTGALLFYETSEDAPSPQQVARWMRNYGAQGILERISGIILGRPGGGIPAARHDDYGAAIAKVLAEYDAEHVALLTGLDFGHTAPAVVLPHGVDAILDCADASVSLADAAVAPSCGDGHG